MKSEIVLYVNEEWLYWMFMMSPDNFSMWIKQPSGRCEGGVKIANGSFSRKIYMNYEIHEDEIKFSAHGMDVVCDFVMENEYANYLISVNMGSVSAFDSADIYSSSEMRLHLGGAAND